MASLRSVILPLVLACACVASCPIALSAEPTSAPAAATEAAKKKIVVLRLSGTLAEKPEGFHFSIFDMSGAKPPALSTLITTADKAAKDASVSAVLFDLSSFSLTLSQAQEMGQLIDNLRTSKKIVAVFASDFDTATYLMASHATVVIMPENGNVLMPGAALNMLFFRTLLDNIHIKPDFVQVGAYKGAEEPFMRTEASPEYKAQIQGLVDGTFAQIKATIAGNRKNMDTAEVAKAIDEGWMTGKRAKELKLVDRNMSRDKVDAYLEETVGEKPEIVKDYSAAKKKGLDLDNPFAILQLLAPPRQGQKQRPRRRRDLRHRHHHARPSRRHRWRQLRHALHHPQGGRQGPQGRSRQGHRAPRRFARRLGLGQ